MFPGVRCLEPVAAEGGTTIVCFAGIINMESDLIVADNDRFLSFQHERMPAIRRSDT